MLTFQLHADVETLLKTAIRTPFSLGFVNDTASFGDTIVHFFVLHCAFEKALTRFTSKEAVVIATHFVPTHGAQFFQGFLGVWLVRLTH